MFDWSPESEEKSLVIKDQLELKKSERADFAVFVRGNVDCSSDAERLRAYYELLWGERERGKVCGERERGKA